MVQALKMTGATVDISVVICTRNRAESLRETLACLARADKQGLRCEVVVVNNGGNDHTPEVARSVSEHLPIRHVYEPRAGKNHALNRALDTEPLGAIIVVLDDDMSPHVDWFKGIKAISDRWPEKEFFTGSSYVIWPTTEVPSWCLQPILSGWAFSVMAPRSDQPVSAGRWLSGNHYWFRSRVLKNGRRFWHGSAEMEMHIYIAEPQFMLQLAEEGFGGIMAPDAKCGHRVQPELLKFDAIQQRAVWCGRGFAEARLRPYRRSVHQARQFMEHPLMARGFCVWRLLKWRLIRFVARFDWAIGRRTARKLQADLEIAYYREMLKIASQMPEYRCRVLFWKHRGGA